MADVLNTSPSMNSVSVSYDTSFDSPSNYTMGRADYEEEGLKRAFLDLLKLTIPITITSLFVSLLLAANLIWIGHHSNEKEFAGAALGNMMVNVMGNSIIIGMTSGLDTQCGQAFGARLYKMMGILVQRSLLMSHIVICVIAVIFWFADDILSALGQNANAAHEAALFIRISIASLWPIAMFGNLRRYLQAQRQVIFIPIAVLIGLIVQIAALILLVNVAGFGYIGCCIALPSSYWSMTLSLYAFTKCSVPLSRAVDATWPGWGKWAWRDWRAFLSLSVAGTFQLCAEWWALEIMALFAGHFGCKYVAALTVTLNIIGVAARLPLGISFSAAVLVGNKLGAQRAMSAKIIYDCSIALSVASGLLFAACLFLLAGPLSHIYTHLESVRSIVEETLPFCGVYFLFYAYQRGSAGGARGMGRQNIGAAIYIFAYYCVGMPFGVWLAYDGLPGANNTALYIKGLWIGAALSAAIGSFFFLFFRFWVNWDHECDRALQRIDEEQDKLMLFKQEVRRKYGDLMEEGGLLEEDDYDYRGIYNERNQTQNNVQNNLGGFKLDNDDSHVTFDEIEPDWNNNRQPKLKGVYAPELSNTHSINSLPSRSLQQPSQTHSTHTHTHTHRHIHYTDNDNNVDNNYNQLVHDSMTGLNQINFDASLVSDVIGRDEKINSNQNNDSNDSSQSSSKHSFV